MAVSRCRFDLKTGRVDLAKTTGFYQVKPTGAWLPRTSWRYSAARHPSPVAASLGSSTFASVPTLSKLFRTDFARETPFDPDWVQVSEADEKAGLTCSTAKLLRTGAEWTVPSADARDRLSRAMLAAGENLFVVTPRGTLTIHRVADGQKLGEMKLDLVAWDCLAAANGNLYVSTADGKVLCLGAR